jgi:hypothetical protein
VTLARRLAVTGALFVGTFAGLRVSFLAPEHCPPQPPSTLSAAAADGGGWIERGQADDGTYVYEYDRAADETLPGYNIVRHAGVTMSLYQLVRAGNDDLLASADLGLAWMLDRLVPAGGGVAFVENENEARLGASALMAAALAQRREATGDGRYDDELRGLATFMTGQITTGGQMLERYDLTTGSPVQGQTSRYATGEASWAFAQLHNLFPGDGWDRPAREVLDYLATERDEVEQLVPPPWPDQWAAYTLGELAPSGLDPEHVDYARRLAERFGVLLRTESQKDQWAVPVIDPRARGAGLGVWVEGIGALGHAAEHDERLADIRQPVAERVACGSSLLADRQIDADRAAEYGTPSLVEGAWFRDDVTRMDDQQHALSGLLVGAGELGPVGQ